MIYSPYSHPLPLPRSQTRRWPRLRFNQWLLLLAMMTTLLATLTNAARAALVSQFAARANHRCYAGPILVGVTVGCHLNRFTAITAQYHPNNSFETGDTIGLGFGEANFVYGQEGIEAYRNLDRHTFVVNGRFYILGPFYMGLGVAHQRGSSRWITFEQQDRMLGNTLYEEISVSVETRLKDQTAPVLAIGLHPAWRRIGIMAEANFGLTSSKRLDEAIITTSKPISEADMTLFREAVRQDAESEGFGIATYGVTYSFSPWGN
ncbi:MAG: hypothetical protein AAF614_32725 [Chloroflexota bacterium]